METMTISGPFLDGEGRAAVVDAVAAVDVVVVPAFELLVRSRRGIFFCLV